MKRYIKRLISILSYIVLCLFIFNAQVKAKNSWDKLNLNGHVKEIRSYNVGTLKKIYIKQTFTSKGYCSKKESYLENGEIISKTKYDRKGRYKKIFNYDINGDLYYTSKMKYNTNDSIRKQCIFKYGKFRQQTIYYNYDENGNRIEHAVYDKYGDLKYKYKYKYDGNGNIVEKAEYSNNGLCNTDSYEYDKNGKCIKYTHNGGSHLFSWEENYKYDGNGFLIKKYHRSDGGSISCDDWNEIYADWGISPRPDDDEYYFNCEEQIITKTIYKYDESGRLNEELCYKNDLRKDNLLITKTIYKYDKSGKLNEQIYYDPEGEISEKRCIKYDEKGNITEDINTDKSGNIINGVFYEYDYYK